MDKRRRGWAMLAAIAAIVVPFALGAMHVVAPAYDIGRDLESFRVIAHTNYFPAVPTQAMLLLTAVGTVIIPVTIVGRLRDALTRAEERLFLLAWQLRATLPAEAQPRLAREP